MPHPFVVNKRGVIMIRRNQKLINRLNALSDAGLVLISYLFASWLWLDVVRNTERNMAALSNITGASIVIGMLYALWTVFMLMTFGAYRITRIHRADRTSGSIAMANTVALLSGAAMLYLFRLEDFSRGVLGVYWLTSTIGLVLKRKVVRRVLRYFRAQGYNLKHMVVVGSGALAQRYIDSANERPSLGIHIKRQFEVNEKLLTRLEKELHGDVVDEVILALEPDELHVTQDVIAVCEKTGTRISVIPFYNDVIPAHPTIDALGPVKLIRLRTTALDDPLNAFGKRAFDVVFSALGLVVLSPLLLVIALAIRVTSPGPVLFRQERVGMNKKNFTMYKFRSMRVNAEQDSAWSTDVDDRRTKLGSILRKTSLDELPQLWNVLIGDMSLVGPRPEIPFYVEQFRETVPLYMMKNQVRPGITGWAQVNGLRGDTSIPERVKYDLWYLENWCFSLDVDILFRTFFGGMINQERLN